MNSFKKFLIISVVLSVSLAVALIATPAMPTSAATPDLTYAISSPEGIVPTYHAGNIQEGDMMPTYMGYKMEWGDLNQTGMKQFDLGGGAWIQVTIGQQSTPHGDKDYVVTWVSSGINIYFVTVKGSNEYLKYAYDGTVTTDGHLWPPRTNPMLTPAPSMTPTPTLSPIAGISHLIFFYMMPQETTTETTSETTTEPLESTVTETTETTIILTTPTIPLTSPTTTEPLESTVTETTTETFITLTTETIPQTGETGGTGSGNGLLIGIILLAMAGGLTFIVYRNRPVKQ